MRRPDTVATAAAALWRALQHGRPPWVSPATWSKVLHALAALRADALAAIAPVTHDVAHTEIFGVGRRTLFAWKSRGAWLGEAARTPK